MFRRKRPPGDAPRANHARALNKLKRLRHPDEPYILALGEAFLELKPTLAQEVDYDLHLTFQHIIHTAAYAQMLNAMRTRVRGAYLVVAVDVAMTCLVIPSVFHTVFLSLLTLAMLYFAETTRAKYDAIRQTPIVDDEKHGVYAKDVLALATTLDAHIRQRKTHPTP